MTVTSAPRLRSPPPSVACVEQSPPYHLAQGLLDHAEHLTRLRDADAAALAIDEARDIARSLRCQPLFDQAADISCTEARVPRSMAARLNRE